ncbi:D-2-hydroxyacid dehydrogenase [Pseudomonas sp. 5P_3.1_Bac2]|uniref:D-2-hydroxyacid dehydrogenase n=1 Tax=Pseudomonas sp. 5P_3.1_Bac2 TaxID=2971617 RepID=UPI0021C82098|nr:D-2-hydroxyacid dehydrogenase [Pseudomonas sp. 5P_3.1_Bac2]MCU1716263.1 D-2-hydroxyacid dehydrogenase [Pseudomonas sp. 5P_3.1_Bac2]
MHRPVQVLIAEQQWQRYGQLLAELAPDVQWLGSEQPAQLFAYAAQCPIWLGQPDLLQPLLAQGLQPDWLQSTWAGITPLLAQGLPRDYQLTRAVGIFGQVMAEYVLGHLLAHERQLFSRHQAQQQQRWDNRLPRSLAGRTALIVGCGDIGHSVAQFLAPFGLELLGIASRARQQAPFKQVLGLAELDQLLPQADYVINLLPDTPATRDLYDAKRLAGFKTSALFINAGRGAAVVEQDLIDALSHKHLAGAVIDVCKQEPLPAGHGFWTADNLLLTGHSAAPTEPGLMAQLFVDNLRRWQHGQLLHGQVDFGRGY